MSMIHSGGARRVAPGLSRTGILSKESEEFTSCTRTFGFVTATLTLVLTWTQKLTRNKKEDEDRSQGTLHPHSMNKHHHRHLLVVSPQSTLKIYGMTWTEHEQHAQTMYLPTDLINPTEIEPMSSSNTNTEQMFFRPSSEPKDRSPPPPAILATRPSSRLAHRRESQRIVSCQDSYKLFKRCEDGDSELLSCDVVIKTYMKCMLADTCSRWEHKKERVDSMCATAT